MMIWIEMEARAGEGGTFRVTVYLPGASFPAPSELDPLGTALFPVQMTWYSAPTTPEGRADFVGSRLIDTAAFEGPVIVAPRGHDDPVTETLKMTLCPEVRVA